MQKTIVLGYDPGGGKKSGKGRSGVGCLALAQNRTVITTHQCQSVAEALEWFKVICRNETPRAIGIDTFLHWGTAVKGWREVDLALRRAYPSNKNSIQPTNSTHGSMAAQGMALAIAAKQNWPKLVLNEVHPKVLFAELTSDSYPRTGSEANVAVRSDFLKSRGYDFAGNLRCEDEFDAALCCIATYEGLERRWYDLMQLRSPTLKEDDLIFPAGKVIYMWPRTLGA